jgi:hypothetical protein
MISFKILHSIGSWSSQGLRWISQPPYSSTLPAGGRDVADSTVIDHAVVQTPFTNIDTIALECSRHLVIGDTLGYEGQLHLAKAQADEQSHGEVHDARVLQVSRNGYISRMRTLLSASTLHHTQLTQQYQVNQTPSTPKPSTSKYAVL